MADKREQAVLDHLRRSRETLERAAGDHNIVGTIVAIADRVIAALRAGGKVLLVGNGGSAADAQHIAAELVGRYAFDRAPMAAIALTTDTSALTAIGNDYAFGLVFDRQLRAVGRKGDVLIAMSTSGTSPNILAALKAARELGITTVGLTGTRSAQMQPLCDLILVAPSDQTPLIQQTYMSAAHAICALVEQEMFPTETRR